MSTGTAPTTRSNSFVLMVKTVTFVMSVKAFSNGLRDLRGPGLNGINDLNGLNEPNGLNGCSGTWSRICKFKDIWMFWSESGKKLSTMAADGTKIVIHRLSV